MSAGESGRVPLAGAPRFLPHGDAALVVSFGEAIDPAINARVMALAAALRMAALPGVVALLPSFRSLLVQYDPLAHSHADMVAAVKEVLAQARPVAQAVRQVVIPACYEAEFAPDLNEVAAAAGMSADAAAALHAGAAYQVFMLGFMPGFPYMGLLPEKLRLPRLATPRLRLPARSIAIATAMTAIYPLESPGGWRLIGAVPVDLFDIARDPPSLLRPGDRVRFRPVPRREFAALRAAFLAGDYRPEIEDPAA
jgi:inhibitor of KinA